MKIDPILNIRPLGFLWPVKNPFLFCAHHRDEYPVGNEQMAPTVPLTGRDIGHDFTPRDGWRMYHGRTVPGFPVHPHRGFETVTITREGLVDHADSHGQGGRYGGGDVQWMTAGSGLQHSEMFPLLNMDSGNTTELFQVWLNLPRARKFADPHYKMLWSEDIPNVTMVDTQGKESTIQVIAGHFNDVQALAPAPDSWAAEPENDVSIWTIQMDPDAQLTLPPSTEEVSRTLYFYRGDTCAISNSNIPPYHAAELRSREQIILQNGGSKSYFLMLQGKPIAEPVVQYGPFVMNSEAEIQQAFADFRRDEFGGWPWPRPDQVFPRERGRFARYRDGSEEVR